MTSLHSILLCVIATAIVIAIAGLEIVVHHNTPQLGLTICVILMIGGRTFLNGFFWDKNALKT